MKKSLLLKIRKYLSDRKRRQRLVRATCALSLCVAGAVFALMKIPAVRREVHNPLIEAKSGYALVGDTIHLEVTATAENGSPETVFLLSAQELGAGLSNAYVFDEKGETELIAESGKTVTLRREAQPDGTVQYWFALPENTTEKLILKCTTPEREAPTEETLPTEAPETEETTITEPPAELTPAPTAEATAKPEPTAEPALTAEPVAEAAPVVEAEPAVEAEPIMAVASVMEAAPVAEAEPVAEAAPVEEAEPAAEIAPEPEPEPAADPAPEAAPVAEPEPAPAPTAVPTVKPEKTAEPAATATPEPTATTPAVAGYLKIVSASAATLERAKNEIAAGEPTTYSWLLTQDDVDKARKQEAADQGDDAEATASPEESPMPEETPAALVVLDAFSAGTLLTVPEIEAAIDDLPTVIALAQMDGLELVNVQYKVVVISDAISALPDEDYERIDEARLMKFMELSDYFNGGASVLNQTGTVGAIVWSYDDVTDTLTLTGSGSVPGSFLQSLPAEQACSTPSKLIIGGGITGIANSAFYGNDCLTEVAIGNGVASIGADAFMYCSMITSLTLPQDNSLRSIGRTAFGFCSSLTSLAVPGSIEEWGELAFSQCTALVSLSLGEGLQTVGTRAFHQCSALSSVTFPASMRKIALGSFSSCLALQSVTLNEGLEQIYPEAFSNSGLRGMITIPSSVKLIGRKALAISDPSLADISITQPSQLTGLGYQFDAGSTSLNGWDYYPGLKNYILNLMNVGGNVQLAVHPDYNGHQDPSGYSDVQHSDNVESTWLTKSAKWADDDLTMAELRIDFSANNRMTDYIFVLDHTGSMALAPESGNQTAKIYSLARLMTKVDNALLNTAGYDNRVAVINFNDSHPYAHTHGFTSDSVTATAYLTTDNVFGGTNYAKPLQAALELINSRSGSEATRPVKVIFLSDGAPNTGDKVDGIYGKTQADALKANGIPIYGILFDTPENESMSYICDRVYSASDDTGLSTAFNEALNNTIGISSKIVDVIEDENFTIPSDAVITVTDADGNVIPDAAAWHTDENGKQIIEWNLFNLKPCVNYTLILRSLQLKTNASGNYPVGALPTNDDDDTQKATVEDVGGSRVNDVDTPVLSRGGYQLPATGGPGLWRLYTCGFVLLSGSLIMLVQRRRKQGGDR